MATKDKLVNLEDLKTAKDSLDGDISELKSALNYVKADYVEYEEISSGKKKLSGIFERVIIIASSGAVNTTYNKRGWSTSEFLTAPFTVINQDTTNFKFNIYRYALDGSYTANDYTAVTSAKYDVTDTTKKYRIFYYPVSTSGTSNTTDENLVKMENSIIVLSNNNMVFYTDKLLEKTDVPADAYVTGKYINEMRIYDTLPDKTIASFPDGANNVPVKDMVAQINPVQDLHGYANPWPGGGGKNKFNPAEAQQNKWINNTTGAIESTNGFWISGYIPVKSGDVVRSTVKGSSRNAWFNADKSQSTYIAYNGGDPSGIVAPADGFFVATVLDSTIAFGGDFCITINNGDITYAPYSNICPITGWTGCNVVRTGVNLFAPDTIGYLSSLNGTITASTQSSGIVTQAVHMPVQPSSTLFAYIPAHSETTNNWAYRVAFYDRNKNWLYTSTLSTFETAYTISIPSNCYYVRFSSWENGAKLTISLTATTKTSENGQIYPITFPSSAGTVYGGTLTVNTDGTGELVVTSKRIMIGSLSWVREEISSLFYIFSTGNVEDRAANTNFITSVFPNKNHYRVELADNEIGVYNTTNGIKRFAVRADSCTTSESFNEAFGGQSIVYELATPVTYQLTASQIRTLYGINNLWADTGKVSVTYPCDTKLYIDRILGTTEDDMTANVNIANNKYFSIGNRLFLSTQAIAKGETIKPGTNCTETSVSDALNALLQ